MALKKKSLKLHGFLFLLLFMLSCVSSFTVCEASTHFNYTSGELSKIYYNLRASSLANSEIEDTTYHDKVVTRWASGDILMESLTDNDWLNITTDLNNFMESYYRSSGDFPMNDGENYKDYASDTFPYWIFAQPCQTYSTSAESINFIFVPYLATAYEINETTSNVNGIRFYKPQSQLFGRSGDNTPTTNVYNAVLLRINPNKTYTIKTNQQGIEYSSVVGSTLSGNGDFFRRKHPIFYNPYNGISYPINVILAYRNNLNTGFYWLNGSSYGELVETKTNFQYNLLTGTITSGDTPNPIPTPSGSGEGGGIVDLTETNNLISDIKDSLTDVPDLSNTHFSSGEIIGSIGVNISGDPYNNFWLFLTNGLASALTSSNRVTSFEWRGETYTIDLDNTMPNYPTDIHNLLVIMTTIGIIFTIIKQIHVMITSLQSGDIDKLLEMNEESGIIDIF